VKVLAVDIGNTKIACAVVDGATVRARARLQPPSPPAPTSAGRAELLDEALRWCAERLAADPLIAGLALASVVPPLTTLWLQRWERDPAAQGRPAMVVDAATRKPYRVSIECPESVGADRFCNIAAAIARGHRSALVVDLGTANTFDLLVEGTFAGGLIAPGLVTAHQALLRAGALLPEVPFEPAQGWVGRDSAEAVRYGSWHQGIGGVEHVVVELLQQYPRMAVLLTGGLAGMAASHLSISSRVLPELTLEGAAALYFHAVDPNAT
jgi:type III pantothenate kinase